MKKISIVILTLVMGSMVTSAAYGASDACCGDPLSCFCYKAENGDWLKGTLSKIPSKVQTKGLQFKETGHLDTTSKAQPQSSGSVKSDIFDRWGKMKTKKDCDTGGGVWAGEDGKGSCTPGLRK